MVRIIVYLVAIAMVFLSVIAFADESDKVKTAIETVTPMMDSDGKWRVSGYYIK